MLDQPQIVEANQQLAAVIRFTIPRKDIRMVMGPGIAELVGAVTAQGIGPAGPAFSHHLRLDPDIFDFEVGVPVRTVHRGPYEGLAEAWEEFNRWIAAQGLRPAPNLWECYVAGPESSKDPAAWRTELNRPVSK